MQTVPLPLLAVLHCLQKQFDDCNAACAGQWRASGQSPACRMSGLLFFFSKAFLFFHLQKQTLSLMLCMQDSGVPLASDQVQFSLLYRKHEKEGLLAKAKELGVSVIAYSPLAQGLLTGKLPFGEPFHSIWGCLSIRGCSLLGL